MLVAQYVISGNYRAFAQIKKGFLGWEKTTGEGDRILRMNVGDMLVPKFAGTAVHGEQDAEAQQAYFALLGLDFDDVVKDYNTIVKGGDGAVPFLLRVTGSVSEDNSTGVVLVTIPVEAEPLIVPLSAQEFLRLRSLPDSVAAQFKGTVSRGRHIQEISASLIAAVRSAGSTTSRDSFLRRYSLVKAQTIETATAHLVASHRAAAEGDEVFLVTRAVLPGLAKAGVGGSLRLEHEAIAQSPEAVQLLLEDAQRKATASDPFNPREALAACAEMIGFLDGATDVLAIDDFARFYDRYRTLNVKVNQAMTLSKRPLPEGIESAPDEAAALHEGSDESDEAAALAGLSVEAVIAALPDGFELPRPVIAAAVTALRAGKHLLLGGPPGTGKTTFGEVLCRVVVGHNYAVTTATADWTTFDTIGGYLPADAGLQFTPGVVLRCLRDGNWLLIDEVNRADIDKAFGPLFTVLSGSDSGSAGRTSVLPYSDAGRSVSIEWTESRSSTTTPYALTPSWRMIGTLNLSDKASLFRLSFAFLRRFAVIDIPLPPRDTYESLLVAWLADAPESERDLLVKAVLEAAHGPVPIGPAIAKDVCRFVLEALASTASGHPSFDSAQGAMVAAFRLFVVPQYEGALTTDGDALAAIVEVALPLCDAEESEAFREALRGVCLT